MAIYILNLLVVSIAAILANKKFDKTGKRKINIWVIIAMASLILVSGFRHRVGTDYQNYVDIYNLNVKSSSIVFEGEFALSIIIKLATYISENPQVFFMITSIIINVMLVIALVKYSENYKMSMYLYITTFTYYSTMNGLRQFIAAMIMFLAFKQLMNRRFIKYLLCVLLATTFHTSALLFIPIYFIVYRRIDSLANLIILTLAIIAFIFYKDFIEILFEFLQYSRFAHYKEVFMESDGANPLRLLVYSIPIILAYMGREVGRYRIGDKYDVIANLSFLGCIFMFLAMRHKYFARVSMYFEVYYLILIPYIPVIFSKKSQKIVIAGIIFGYLAFSTLLLLRGEAWIYPYKYKLQLF